MKLFSLLTLTLAVCFLAVGMVSAQVSQKATPVSFGKSLPNQIQTITTSPIDVEALLAEDKIEEAEGIPFRFGYPFDVTYNLKNSGSWEEFPDGSRLWRLKISCPGAYSINLIYSQYNLPEAARLFLYDENREMVLGAFTSFNNKEHGQFATAPTKGEVSILEYYEPSEVRGHGELEISRIVHGYKDVFNFGGAKDGKDFGESGACNNNVNCPEGLPWQDDKRAAAMITTSGGFRLCSGAMVNNVRQDQTPYFLTANHCLGGEATWVFIFNYESPSCSNIDGPTNQSVSGCTKRANYATSDFALLELSETPPAAYNVYYAGWSNLDVASTASTGIHHPNGDIKKISFDYQPVTSTDYLGSTGTSHWRIGQWEDGTTEPGSSGSPLFDQNHRIVGQLHGGYASCTSITSDWYGKVAMSWNGGGASTNRLSNWLDPDNTGAIVLDGYDPYAGVTITHTALPNTVDTINDYEVIATIRSSAPLVPESTLLFYEINPPASEQYALMTATGGLNEFHGYIPAQTAGTVIEYYIYSLDTLGRADTSEIYTFTVQYVPIIAVEPVMLSQTIEAGDSSSTPLIIANSGQATLNYDIDINFALKINEQLKGLMERNALEPASRDYPAGFDDYPEDKDYIDFRRGFPVDKSAGGPDNFGYYWVDSDEPGGAAFDWIDITTIGTDITAGLDDDNHIGPFAINFYFPFYGASYNYFHLASNGFIGFDTTNMRSRQKVHIPSATTPNNIIAWLWDDLDITDADNTTGRVYIHSDTTRCVIQFVDIPEYNAQPGEVVNAEVILYADGTIKFQYLDIATGFDILNCAIGIENATGNDGLEVAYLTNYLHDSLAVTFYLPFKWLTLSQLSGTLYQGEADTINCKFNSGVLDSGTYDATIIVASNDPDAYDNPWNVPAQLHITQLPQYVCGDANGSGTVTVLDVTFLLTYLYKGGPAPAPLESGDANGNGVVNVLDITHLLNYLYKGGPAPICP